MESIEPTNSIIEDKIEPSNSKASKVLLILGVITLVISTILFVLNLVINIERFAAGGDSFEGAISVVLGIVFYLVPGGFFELLSLIFIGVSLYTANKRKNRGRKVMLALSLVLFVGYIIQFILLIA